MKIISKSQFHKGFYQLTKEYDEIIITGQNDVAIGVWLGRAGTTAYLGQKEGIEGVVNQTPGTTVVGSQKVGILQNNGTLRELTPQELKTLFPQVDALVPGEDIQDHIDLEEKCIKCDNKSDGIFSEITDSDGWQEFNICKSCAKKFRVKINKKL